MKLTIEHYEEMRNRDELNSNGLKHYISLLRGEIKDHSDRIKEVIKDKGLHKKPRGIGM